MLDKIGQKRQVPYDFNYMESRKQNKCTKKIKQKQTPIYRRQTTGYQSGEGLAAGKIRDSEVQTSSYKITHGDIM